MSHEFMTHEWERAHSLMACLSWYVFGSWGVKLEKLLLQRKYTTTLAAAGK